MLYDFLEETHGNIESYVDDGSWPVTIDSFVEFYKKKLQS
jgi:hypothetical protein